MATTTPEAVRRGLLVLSGAALADLAEALRRVPPSRGRNLLLTLGPSVMEYRTSGSSALAADWYEELREASNPAQPFTVTAPAWQREEKFARALVWATEPIQLDDPNLLEALSRLGTAVEYETFDAFTETVDANVRDDAEAIGWSRNANYAACKFCLMLAGRGAVYRKQESAQFAAHSNCQCTVIPAFRGGDNGPEASVIQYQASKRYRTKAEREANNARVRDYLNQNYPDARG